PSVLTTAVSPHVPVPQQEVVAAPAIVRIAGTRIEFSPSAPSVASSRLQAAESGVGRFYAHEPVDVGGHRLAVPLTYVANACRNPDASTIITSLPVGRADRATPTSYWPSYSALSPDQRARYLEWMAGGRQTSDVDIGYPFIFFY